MSKAPSVVLLRVPEFEFGILEHGVVAVDGSMFSASRRRAGQYIGLTVTPL
jgi:hypothetical protein